ncbi:MAG: 1-deoxy-D-xylulose-5-phosphate synthase [Planctomycetes bacterium]|nr:1-deoxy-D-xylulose-5-phosphate synthase [Planctomycetota bacterium]
MENLNIIDRISSPSCLRSLSFEELRQLATEIRSLLTSVISENGGHLASNLGIVELTLALHRVYDFKQDRLVFDVGHQCYTHKILTGRKDSFHTLRQHGGITGFPNPLESEYDPFVVGHASTSISSALGLATAFRLQGLPHKSVAVVGDGAISGGMCFEAMNNAGHAGEDLLVILNDNEMSIAKTVGAFSTYLTEIRSNPTAHGLREEIHKIFQSIPLIGRSLDWVQERILTVIKNLIDESHIFSSMGFRYFGPINGRDTELLESELKNLRQQPGPKILHVVTVKGEGFDAAAADPETYHSAVPFEVKGHGEVVPRKEKTESYTNIFVTRLIERAVLDENIVAITAAMPSGTGINLFADKFPGRFFDVGICEAHSVTFAAGLARSGIKPVLAIYSTFLQRGYDQIVHDIALQPEMNVVFAIDRAGLVGADGATHHGVFDIAMLRHIPGMTLMAPRDGEEMGMMLDFALKQSGPVAIRYPRGCPPENTLPRKWEEVRRGNSELIRVGEDGTVFAYGRMVEPAMKAANELTQEGLNLRVINARFAKPLDEEAIRLAATETPAIFTVEDHALSCGFGSAVAEFIADDNIRTKLVRIGIPDSFVEHGNAAILDKILGLDVEGLKKKFRENLS